MRNYNIMFENSKEGVPVLMVFESNNSIFGMSSSPFNIIALHTGDDATHIWNEMTAKPHEEDVIRARDPWCKGGKK